MSTETSFNFSDASQIFPHWTKEVSDFYLDTAQKNADKVYKIALKFIIVPPETEEKEVPAILIPGSKPIWTKPEVAYGMRLFVRDKKLHAEPQDSFKTIKPLLDTAQKLRIEAKAFIYSANPAVFDDPVVAEKTWVYLPKSK